MGHGIGPDGVWIMKNVINTLLDALDWVGENPEIVFVAIVVAPIIGIIIAVNCQ